MYKLLFTLLIGCLFFQFSCGTSQEEQAADAKRKQDSLGAAESAMRAAEDAARVQASADSANYAAIKDSIDKVSAN